MAVILCGVEKNDNEMSVHVHLLIHAKRKKVCTRYRWQGAESVMQDAQVQKSAYTVNLVRWDNGRVVTERERSH